MGKLLRFRQEFPSVERFTYLYAGRLGPMHRNAPKALAKYTSDWETQGGAGWVERWREDAAPLAASLASLLGVSESEILILPSTESAARSIPCSQETSIAYEAAPDGSLSNAPDWLPAFATNHLLPIATEIEAFIQEKQPQFLVLSHASPLSGKLRSNEELRAITKAAEKVGTKVILDIERSIGVVPIKLTELQPYAVVGSCARWLCGGPGSAFLWITPAIPKQNQEVPSPTSYLIAEITARLISQIGVEQIREKSIRQTQRLIDGALARGFAVNTPRQAEQRGGTVAILVPHAKAVFHSLRERRYLLDYHEQVGLLASPHFYTADDELDAFLSQLDDILDRRDYERFNKR
jgi:kynureninase